MSSSFKRTNRIIIPSKRRGDFRDGGDVGVVVTDGTDGTAGVDAVAAPAAAAASSSSPPTRENKDNNNDEKHDTKQRSNSEKEEEKNNTLSSSSPSSTTTIPKYSRNSSSTTTTTTTTISPKNFRTLIKLRGVKPWIGGIQLTSFGHNELDGILGGGQPIGTCVLLEQDRFTDLATTLCKYWVANALSTNQTLLLLAAEAEVKKNVMNNNNRFDNDVIFGISREFSNQFISSLPRDLHLDKFRANAKNKTKKKVTTEKMNNVANMGGNTLNEISIREEEEDEEEVEENDKDEDKEQMDNNNDMYNKYEGDDDDDDYDEETKKNESETKKNNDNNNNNNNSSNNHEEEEEDGLKIAWQYRSSIQNARSGGIKQISKEQQHEESVDSSSLLVGDDDDDDDDEELLQSLLSKVYCHSYDLSGRMIDQYPPGTFKFDFFPAKNDDTVDVDNDSSPPPNGEKGSNDDYAHGEKNITDEKKKKFDNNMKNIKIAVVDCTSDSILSSSSSFAKNSSTVQSRGITLFRSLLERIYRELSSSLSFSSDPSSSYNKCSSSKVIRLLIMNAHPGICSIAIPLLLSIIRNEELPVVILVTVKPWLLSLLTNTTYNNNDKDLILLERCCDTVLSIDSFISYRETPASEFRDLLGILHIKKFGTMSIGHFANRYPPAMRYGLKRDRRKLQIQMLHLPPEDFSTGGSSVGTGSVRTGGGRTDISSAVRDANTNNGFSSGGGGGVGSACGGASNHPSRRGRRNVVQPSLDF